MRSLDEGYRSLPETLEDEEDELEEEGLFWEVAAQVAAQRPQEEDPDVTRLPEAPLGLAPGMPFQGEPSFVPLPRATLGFQSPVLLSPRVAHRVIDLTTRSVSSAAPPLPQEQQRRAQTPWLDRHASSPAVRGGPRQGGSRLRKSSSAEAKAVQKAGGQVSLPAQRCPPLGRRRMQVEPAARAHHASASALQPRPVVRTGTAPVLGGTAPSSPVQTTRQLTGSTRPLPLPVVAPLPGFAHVPGACAPLTVGPPRRSSSPLTNSLRPVPTGGDARPSSPLGSSVRPVSAGSSGGSPYPPAPLVVPAVHSWVPVPQREAQREHSLLGTAGLASASAQAVRAPRNSISATRIPEEDALAASGNVSTIAPADEHAERVDSPTRQDESFAETEVAGSMIISNREQAVAGHPRKNRHEVDLDTDSDNSSLHNSGLANETELIYPPPDRLACASSSHSSHGLPPRPVAVGTHVGGPVPVYFGREPPAQMSVGTTASTSTGRSESEANSEFLTLESWGRSAGLPEVVLQRLRDEHFQCPEHLIHLDREDMKEMTEGLKLGDRCCFINAVQQLKDNASSRAGLPPQR